MSEVCEYLHKKIVELPLYSYDSKLLPENGIYFLFEKGEISHNVNRIVRIGTHNGQGRLLKRINEHFFTPNKDRSIFRKHLGRCLLAKENDCFLDDWEIDLTTAKNREKYSKHLDFKKLAITENIVTDYIKKNFFLSLLEIDDKMFRLKIEKKLIGTLANCCDCIPSTNWIGHYHPNKKISENGIWNIQGLKTPPFSLGDVKSLFSKQ
jgi:hypothetical protein